MICFTDEPLLAAALHLRRSYVAVLPFLSLLNLCGPVMRKIKNVIKLLGYELFFFLFLEVISFLPEAEIELCFVYF